MFLLLVAMPGATSSFQTVQRPDRCTKPTYSDAAGAPFPTYHDPQHPTRRDREVDRDQSQPLKGFYWEAAEGGSSWRRIHAFLIGTQSWNPPFRSAWQSSSFFFGFSRGQQRSKSRRRSEYECVTDLGYLQAAQAGFLAFLLLPIASLHGPTYTITMQDGRSIMSCGQRPF